MLNTSSYLWPPTLALLLGSFLLLWCEGLNCGDEWLFGCWISCQQQRWNPLPLMTSVPFDANLWLRGVQRPFGGNWHFFGELLSYYHHRASKYPYLRTFENLFRNQPYCNPVTFIVGVIKERREQKVPANLRHAGRSRDHCKIIVYGRKEMHLAMVYDIVHRV